MAGVWRDPSGASPFPRVPAYHAFTISRTASSHLAFLSPLSLPQSGKTNILTRTVNVFAFWFGLWADVLRFGGMERRRAFWFCCCWVGTLRFSFLALDGGGVPLSSLLGRVLCRACHGHFANRRKENNNMPRTPPATLWRRANVLWHRRGKTGRGVLYVWWRTVGGGYLCGRSARDARGVFHVYKFPRVSI